MPLTTLPAVFWGPTGDINAFTASTCTVLPGQADPFGGTGAYKLTSTVAGGRRISAAFVLPSAINELLVMMKADSSAKSTFTFRDQTNGADRGGVTAAWSGGVPTPSAYLAGAPAGAVSIGGGWYAFPARVSSMIAGATHTLDLYPDYNAGVVGSTYFCLRQGVLLDLFDEAISWEEDREGSEYVQGPSGFEDAARVGLDHYLEGRVRYVPQAIRNDPGPASGWYGENESIGVNCGVKALLRAGREKQLLRWVPDRTLANAGNDAYLVEPIRERPGLERNWERAFTMRLRSASVFAGV